MFGGVMRDVRSPSLPLRARWRSLRDRCTLAPDQGRERPDAAGGGSGEIGGLRGIGTATPEMGKCVSARTAARKEC